MKVVRSRFLVPTLAAVLTATAIASCGDSSSGTDGKSDAARTAQQALEPDVAPAEPGTANFRSNLGDKGITPLFLALKEQNVEAVRTLLNDEGVDPNETPFADGLRPLHTAAGSGSVECTRALLAKNADVDAQQARGATALNVATSLGHLEVVRLLIEGGANVNLGDVVGRAPLHNIVYAIDEAQVPVERALEIAELLVDNGANVDVATRSNNTPLIVACEFGMQDFAKFLLEKGANPNVAGSEDATPLHYAVVRGDTEVVRMLVDAGADPNAKAADKTTPVLVAKQKKFDEISQLLAGAGGE